MNRLFEAYAVVQGWNTTPKRTSDEEHHLGAPYYTMPFYEIIHAIDYNTYNLEFQIFIIDEDGNRSRITKRLTSNEMEKFLMGVQK
jgi:hypothetical protein